MAVVTYTISNANSALWQDIKRGTDGYFLKTNIPRTATPAMKNKIVLYLVLYFSGWIFIMITPSLSNLWLITIYSFMGLAMPGLAFNGQHDGNHGAYSKNSEENKRVGLLLNVLGGIAYFWEWLKHTPWHHFGVNILGLDQDIDSNGVLRMSPHQKWKWWHALQPVTMLIFYGLFPFLWVLPLDFMRYASIVKAQRGGSTDKAIIGFDSRQKRIFWITKLWYVLFWFVIPTAMLSLRFDFYPALMFVLKGYLIQCVISGLIFTFTFQVAHVIYTSVFPVLNADGKLDGSFATHQIGTTGNFSPGSKFAEHYFGGLGNQIEHHLFPSIAHAHYGKLSIIVKESAKKYGVPYREFSWIGAGFRHYLLMVMLAFQIEYPYVTLPVETEKIETTN